MPFNISAEKKWVLQSWDQFQIPMPFSRILVLIGDPIFVKPDATKEELEVHQQNLQRSMESLLSRSDAYWSAPAIK